MHWKREGGRLSVGHKKRGRRRGRTKCIGEEQSGKEERNEVSDKIRSRRNEGMERIMKLR